MQPIVGRERETGVLAELIGRVHERGAALVVRGEAGDLPDPQRDALLTAFGMTSAPAPDLFLIALAALDLVADDAQWLARSSGGVLAFVA